MNALIIPPAIALAAGSTTLGSLLARQRAKGRYQVDLGTMFPPVAAGVTLSIASAVFDNGVVDALIGVLLICAATICAWTDLRAHYIFERVILLFIVPLVFLQALTGNVGGSLMGVVVLGAGAFGAIYVLKGRGFALGDVTLLALFGAGLGVKDGFAVLALAFVVGGVVCGVGMLLKKIARGTEVAFAPFMLGGLLIWLVARKAAIL